VRVVRSQFPLCRLMAMRPHRLILERELETVGLRLNKERPNISIEKKMSGGIKFAQTAQLTRLGPDPAKTIYSILHEYKIHNAHVRHGYMVASSEGSLR
jgi:ribosome-interacting GTPase 1